MDLVKFFATHHMQARARRDATRPLAKTLGGLFTPYLVSCNLFQPSFSYPLSNNSLLGERLRIDGLCFFAMNGHAATASYLDRLEVFRKADAERDALVAEVIQKYEELQLKYSEKCDDYSNEVESRRMWQGKASAQERVLTQHKQASVSIFLTSQ